VGKGGVGRRSGEVEREKFREFEGREKDVEEQEE
jgi:hypothetical protein